MIPILKPDGTEARLSDDTAAFPTAASKKPRRAEPIDPASFLDEPHHRLYGRPWVIGRCYFDQLKAQGLERGDKVLDLGCGAGRVGVWLAGFLDEGGYCGVDAHLRALAAFAAYECVLHGLEAKRPRLMHTDGFEVEAFGETFDVALDFYTTPHLSKATALDALARTAAVCRPGARLYSLTPKLASEEMAKAGFRLEESFRVDYPLLGHLGPKGGDDWQVFVRGR
jgi:SAM-dependent methyltransferase